MADPMERRLRAAIREGGLQVHYQPLVALPTGQPIGAEALTRWTDVRGVAVAPETFIGLAERSGLIHELGGWVLREACRAAAGWSPLDSGPTVAVNVSPVQLARPSVVADVAAALEASGLPARRLHLEMTETAAVLDLDETAATLARLRALGVRIALDDFGTGFSSLTMLRRLPLDHVKIDRSFVAGVHRSAQDVVVVRLAIEAAHLLGQTVCAEGVETEEQFRQLVAMGCDTAQGWHFGVPQPDSPELAARLAGSAVTGTTTGVTGPGTAAAARTSPAAARVAGRAGPSTQDLVCAMSPQGVLRYLSAAAVPILGRSPEELVGTSVADLLHPDDRPPRDGASHWLTGPTVRRVRHADGGYRWLSTSVQRLRDDSGQVRELVATSRDVTALVETRQRLEASEERFRGAFDRAPIGMALTDLSGRVLRVNQAMAALLGRRQADLVGVTVAELTHPDDLAADTRNLRRLVKGTDRAQRVVKRYLHADGSPVPAQVWAATIEGGDGLPALVVAHVLPAGDEVVLRDPVTDLRDPAERSSQTDRGSG